MSPPGRAAELETRRRRAVVLLAERKSLTEVTELVAADVSSIKRWKQAEKAGGYAAPKSKPIPGRPAKRTAAHKRRLAKIVRAGPLKAGFTTDWWVCKRLHSLSPTDEQALYEATDDCFRNFLHAAIHTGLRPFCEMAKLTADHVEVTDRGMMWRVYSSKTKQSRKIPVHREVAKLTPRLMATAPRGSGKPLFRNSQN